MGQFFDSSINPAINLHISQKSTTFATEKRLFPSKIDVINILK